MSVFTPVTPEQLTAWLRHFSVGTLSGLEGIAEGVENSNFLVTTSHGRFVLTLFERLTRDELPFYVHLMAHLARHGIPCPAPVANRENEYLGSLNGRPAVLSSFLPGASLLRATPAQCAAVGAMLADLHVAGHSYKQRLDNPRGPRWWRETAPKVMPFLDEADREMLKEELRFHHASHLEDLPRGVIHADLFRDNVLFEADRITGIVDFYFAGQDALLYDVAVTLNAWCSLDDGGLDDASAQALLNAYHALRPLTRVEHLGWPAMLRGAALRFWLSRLHDLHLPRPGEMVRVRNPEQFRDILRRRIEAGPLLPWV
ncbi:MAG: homoserine kinase [Rhodocyclaceae bacterium]|nr:homoserine kinase [Rhodocyclaceae bacterium]